MIINKVNRLNCLKHILQEIQFLKKFQLYIVQLIKLVDILLIHHEISSSCYFGMSCFPLIVRMYVHNVGCNTHQNYKKKILFKMTHKNKT